MTKNSNKKILNKNVDQNIVYQKIMKYCAYQERSEYDVIEKLRKYELHEQEIIGIIEKLKQENFINNKRFARFYVAGKFRYNRWGRIKIRYELKHKSFEDEEIISALRVIDDEEYEKMIIQLIHRKEKFMKNPDIYIKQNEIVKFICSKGFEYDIVWDLVKKAIS